MSPPQRRSRLLLRLRQAAEGEELLTLLTAPDEDTFVAQLIAGLGTYPTYFDRLGEINRRGPAVLTAQPLLPDSAPQVRALTADGAHVVDVRPAADYAAAHIPGSLSIPLRDQFATWLGWLLPDTAPLAFVAGEAAGALTARFRRKQLLVAGWLLGIPVPSLTRRPGAGSWRPTRCSG